ncbi:MAG: site-2 protease family protein [Actinomycetota bacterium]|nr:site-2 protease family protein [Actinomycetota bacterium]
MLKSSIKLFKIFGIEIRLDYSWFIIFALLVYFFGFNYFPYILPDLNKAYIAIITVVMVLLFFFSILFHELSHSLVAKKMGIPVGKISLFIFGGMSEMEKEPDKPISELLMSIAGPAASFFLAIIFLIIWIFTKNIVSVNVFIGYLAYINLALGIFNLLPGFPLDGGRILRSIIWKVTGNLKKATFIASTIGRVIGFLMVAVGIYFIFINNLINGIWLAFIGWFLQSAAYMAYRQLIFDSSLKGFKVKDVMNENIIVVKKDITIGDMVNNYFMKHRFGRFPVVEDMKSKKLIGLVSVHDVKTIPREDWDLKTAEDIVKKVTDKEIIDANAEATEVLKKMSINNLSHLVILSEGKIIGMITKSDVLYFIQINSELN